MNLRDCGQELTDEEGAGWNRFLLCWLVALVLGGLLTGVAAPAGAADDDGTSGEDGEGEVASTGEIVVTADPYQVSPFLPGGEVETIEVEPYRENFANLADLIGSLGGVTVTRYGNPVALSTLSDRGAPSSQTRVLLNGVPLSAGAAGSFDFSQLSLEDIGRVEISRGGSLLGAPGSAGLTVNLITRAEPGNRVTVTGGSFSSGEFDLRVSPGERRTFRLGYLQSRGDFPFTTPSGDPRERRNNEAKRFDLRIDHLGENLSATLLAFDDQQGVPGPAEFPTDRAGLHRAGAVLNLSIPDRDPGPGELTGGLNLQWKKTRFFNPQPRRATRVGSDRYRLQLDGVVRSVKRRWGGRRVIQAEAQVVSLKDSEVGNPTRQRLGAALAWHSERGPWRLSPSLRLDYASDRAVAMGFGTELGYRIGERSELSLRYRDSMRFPSFQELYLTDFGFLSGNPELNDERAQTWELTYSRELNDSLEGELRLFRADYDNQIHFLPVDFFRSMPQNTGGSEARGVELSLDWDPGPRWRFRLSGEVLDAQFADGTELPGRPDAQVGLSAVYDRAPWNLSTSLTHIAPRPFRPQATLASESYTGLAVTASWELSARHRIELSGRNLLDDARFDRLDFPLPGRRAELRWSWDF